jgi:hypothetical protein
MKTEAYVFHDPTEARKRTRVPADLLELSKPSPKLEELTGADFVISTLKAPIRTLAIARKHAEAGALFVQRKSGNDLLSSLDDRRLFASTFKMSKTRARMSQTILLTTGIFAPFWGDGQSEAVTMVGQPQFEAETWPNIAWVKNYHLTWSRFTASMSKSVDRGLRWEQVLTDADLTAWFKMKMRHLVEYDDKNTKHLYPTPEYPEQVDARPEALQMPVVVTDWRLALSTVPGFGPTKCEAVKAFCDGQWVWPMLSDPSNIGRNLPKGIGKSAVDKFRAFFGLDDDFAFGVVPITEFGATWHHCGVHNILYVSAGGDDCPLCHRDQKTNWVDPLQEQLNASRADRKDIPGDGLEQAEIEDDSPPWNEDDDGDSKVEADETEIGKPPF